MKTCHHWYYFVSVTIWDRSIREISVMVCDGAQKIMSNCSSCSSGTTDLWVNDLLFSPCTSTLIRNRISQKPKIVRHHYKKGPWLRNSNFVKLSYRLVVLEKLEPKTDQGSDCLGLLFFWDFAINFGINFNVKCRKCGWKWGGNLAEDKGED
jgi:hypothetical protein